MFLDLPRFLWANKYTAYVFILLALIFLVNQLDRFLLAVSKIPFVDYDGEQYCKFPHILPGRLFI